MVLNRLVRLLCWLKIRTEILGTNIPDHADCFGTLGVFNDFLNVTVAAHVEVVTDVGLDLVAAVRDRFVLVLNSIQRVHFIDL